MMGGCPTSSIARMTSLILVITTVIVAAGHALKLGERLLITRYRIVVFLRALYNTVCLISLATRIGFCCRSIIQHSCSENSKRICLSVIIITKYRVLQAFVFPYRYDSVVFEY